MASRALRKAIIMSISIRTGLKMPQMPMNAHKSMRVSFKAFPMIWLTKAESWIFGCGKPASSNMVREQAPTSPSCEVTANHCPAEAARQDSCPFYALATVPQARSSQAERPGEPPRWCAWISIIPTLKNSLIGKSLKNKRSLPWWQAQKSVHGISTWS